jgi:hypothetical protein
MNQEPVGVSNNSSLTKKIEIRRPMTQGKKTDKKHARLRCLSSLPPTSAVHPGSDLTELEEDELEQNERKRKKKEAHTHRARPKHLRNKNCDRSLAWRKETV